MVGLYDFGVCWIWFLFVFCYLVALRGLVVWYLLCGLLCLLMHVVIVVVRIDVGFACVVWLAGCCLLFGLIVVLVVCLACLFMFAWLFRLVGALLLDCWFNSFVAYCVGCLGVVFLFVLLLCCL